MAKPIGYILGIGAYGATIRTPQSGGTATLLDYQYRHDMYIPPYIRVFVYGSLPQFYQQR